MAGGSAATKIERVDVCGAELLLDAFGKEYAAYVCRVIQTPPNAKVWHILRRYSDWEQLRVSLPQKGAAELPKFPAKQLFGNIKPQILEARRLALQSWIAAAMRTPSLCNSDAVRPWLLPTQDDLDYDREYGHSQLLEHNVRGVSQPEPQSQPAPQVGTRLSPPEPPADASPQHPEPQPAVSAQAVQPDRPAAQTDASPQLEEAQTAHGFESDENVAGDSDSKHESSQLLEHNVRGVSQPEPQSQPASAIEQRLSLHEPPADASPQHPEPQPAVSAQAVQQDTSLRSPSPVVQINASPQLEEAQTAHAFESDENVAGKEYHQPRHLRLKTVGKAAKSITRMRTDSADVREGDARVPPACDGRYEYVVAFARGDDALSVANDVAKLLSEHELCVESVSSTQQKSAPDTSQHSLLVTTSAAQFDLQAERDSYYKWTKQNDALTGMPRKKLFTRSRCEEFAGQFYNGKLRHEFGTQEFFSATERARMVYSIMDDLRAKDDSCAALLSRVAEMKDYCHISSPQLEHESLIDALLRAGTG